jgi:hypothetical protein
MGVELIDSTLLDKIKNEIQSRLQPMTLVASVQQGPNPTDIYVKLSDGWNHAEGKITIWEVMEDDAASRYDSLVYRLVMLYAKQAFLVKR